MVRNPHSTPRSRYNSAFISKLQKTLENDPEADLHQAIAKYDRKRFQKLRGTSSDFYTIPKAKEVARHTPSTERCIPEPNGDFVVISPLASQVQDLIGLNSPDTSNTPADTIWRLLRDGTVLHQLLSKWVIRITPTIVVKFAPSLDISEIQTMYYIWSHRKSIPMPEPLGAVSIGGYNYIFMSNLEGLALGSLWSRLEPDLKNSIRLQLGEILQCLREMPLPSMYFGSGNPPRCRDLRRQIRTSLGLISNEAEFNKFLASTDRKLNPTYLDLCTSGLGISHKTVMTHGDIRPDNILVQYITPDTLKISGLVDWELSGAYPEYWEYVKSLAGVNCDSSDWFSYLPTDVIGNHSEEWRQDCLVSRVVL